MWMDQFFFHCLNAKSKVNIIEQEAFEPKHIVFVPLNWCRIQFGVCDCKIEYCQFWRLFSVRVCKSYENLNRKYLLDCTMAAFFRCSFPLKYSFLFCICFVFLAFFFLLLIVVTFFRLHFYSFGVQIIIIFIKQPNCLPFSVFVVFSKRCFLNIAHKWHSCVVILARVQIIHLFLFLSIVFLCNFYSRSVRFGCFGVIIVVHQCNNVSVWRTLITSDRRGNL